MVAGAVVGEMGIVSLSKYHAGCMCVEIYMIKMERSAYMWLVIPGLNKMKQQIREISPWLGNEPFVGPLACVHL